MDFFTFVKMFHLSSKRLLQFTEEPSQVRLFGGSFYQAGKTADSLWFHGQSVAATEPLGGLLYILLYTLYNEGITDEQRRSTSWLVAAVNTP